MTTSPSELTHAKLFGVGAPSGSTSRTYVWCPSCQYRFNPANATRRKKWRRGFDGRWEPVDMLPTWYANACKAVSRALWRHELTDREASLMIAVLHPLATAEAFGPGGDGRDAA
jgi:hypothetical protein